MSTQRPHFHNADSEQPQAKIIGENLHADGGKVRRVHVDVDPRQGLSHRAHRDVFTDGHTGMQ